MGLKTPGLRFAQRAGHGVEERARITENDQRQQQDNERSRRRGTSADEREGEDEDGRKDPDFVHVFFLYRLLFI